MDISLSEKYYNIEGVKLGETFLNIRLHKWT